MYPIESNVLEKFQSGAMQHGRLTMNRNPIVPPTKDVYNLKLPTSCKWNQRVKNGNFADGYSYWYCNTNYGSISAANGKLTYSITTKNPNAYVNPAPSYTEGYAFPEGHTFLVNCWVTLSVDEQIGFYTGSAIANRIWVKANTRTHIVGYVTRTSNTNSLYMYVGRSAGLPVGATAVIENFCVYDLTDMFGAGNEWMGDSFLKNFTEDYYAPEYLGDDVPYTCYCYGGEVDYATGVLTVRNRIVKLDSVYWVLNSTYKQIYQSAVFADAWQPTVSSERYMNILCSAFPASAEGHIQVNYGNNGIDDFSMLTANGAFYIRCSASENDVYSLMQRLTKAELVYKLASPITYQMSPVEVQTLLNDNAFTSDADGMSVTYRNTAGQYVTVPPSSMTDEPIVIHDGARNMPVQSLAVAMSAKQDLNGYTKPWASGCGKNKIDDSIKQQYSSQIVSIGGLYSRFYLSLPAGEYTFSVNFDKMPYYLYYREESGSANVSILLGSTTSSTTSKTITLGGGVYRFWAYRSDADGGVDIDHIQWMQIEVGSSPTAYEPYENICPITGTSQVNVYRQNQNLLADKELYPYSSGRNYYMLLTRDYDEDEHNYYMFLKAGEYTLSYEYDGDHPIGGIGYFDESEVFHIISYLDDESDNWHTRATVTLAEDGYYCFAVLSGTRWGYDEINDFIGVMLEYGDTPKDLVIKNNRIVQGGFSINRYCTTGGIAMVGSCVAAELDVVLENTDGYFNGENFVAKELKAEVGVEVTEGVISYVPLGYFTIDDAPKKLAHISISALDRMMMLEKEISAGRREAITTFPNTNQSLLQQIKFDIEELRFARNYLDPEEPEDDLTNNSIYTSGNYATVQTYRDLLSAIAESSGTCAYFDYNGKLVLDWFSDEPAFTITKANRISSDIKEEAVTISGVEIKTETETFFAGDRSGFILEIAQNPIITDSGQEFCDGIYEKVHGLSYYPFSAEVLPAPHLYPMDGATFVDQNGVSRFVAITDCTFHLNGNTALAGKGQSSQEANYGRKYGISESGANLDDALALLRDTILKNAEIVEQTMQTLEQTLHGEINALSSEYGQFKQETNARITANAEGITQAYSYSQEIDSKYGVALNDANENILALADGAVARNTNFRSITEAYIKSGLLWYEGTEPIYGVATGQLTYEYVNGEKVIKRQGVYSVFTPEEMAFYVNDIKVAYMKNNKLFISAAEFVDSIKVGRYVLKDEGANGFTIKYGG